MKLDALDVEFIEHAGTPQETLNELLGWRNSEESSKIRRRIIKKYINYKKDKVLEEREPGEMEQTVIKADGSITTQRLLELSETESQDPTFVMKLMGYDPLQWKLVWCKVKRGYWDVSMKLRTIIEYDTDGKAIYQEVPEKKTNHTYKCEISVKPIQDIINTEIINSVFDNIKLPKIKPIQRTEKGNVLVELSILDFHLGKDLSLQDEVSLYENTVMAMLSKMMNNNIRPEKFLFQVGQDFIHIDNANKTTTLGTQIDANAGLWSDIYKTAVDLLLWTAEQLRNIAPVHFVYVPGNHDKTLSFCLALTLDKVYKDCPDVTVDAVDYPRKYYQYGLNGIGMSHGRNEGKRIQNKMQEEAVNMFASTVYREFHLGDLHHEKVEEVGGIIYRRTSAITDLDQWHIDKGYKAIRKAPMYVWYKDGGKDILDVLVKV